MRLLYVLFITTAFLSCTTKDQKSIATHKSNSLIQYANGFDIEEFNGYYKLTITTPYQNSENQHSYILAKKDFQGSSLSDSLEVISIPVKSIVPTSTTHIPMIEVFDMEHLIVGFPNLNYVSSEKTRNLIDTGKIKELGMDASLNTEVVLELNPDVIIGFSVSGSNRSLETLKRSGIKVIYNGAWLEKTPLGRAEWVKLFGLLFDSYDLANRRFNEIATNYNTSKNKASKMTSQPQVLTGAMFKDIWNVPAGESFVAQFLKDANTNYLWKDTKGKGSLQLSFETVLDKGKNADLWIGPGGFSSIDELVSSNQHYKEFRALQEKDMYTFANTKGATGGLLYFELGALRPDLILTDVIKIAHPSLLQDQEFTFFEKMD